MLRFLRGCFFAFLLWLIAWPTLHLLLGALEEKGITAAVSQIVSETLSPTTLRTGALARVRQ